MAGTPPDILGVMRVIDHPTRKRIIELLGSKGSLTWKDISGELGVGTGALYYHIDALEGIVTRDDSKKYLLTDFGDQVYRYLNHGDGGPLIVSGRNSRSSSVSAIENILAPRPLIDAATSSPLRLVGSLVVVSIIGALLSIYSGNEIILFSFTPLRNPLLSTGSFLLSLVIVTLLAYITTYFAFKAKPDPMVLLTSSSFAFLPVLSFAYVVHLLAASQALGPLSNGSFLTVVLVLFQAWSLAILGAGMSVSSGLRIERVLLVGLVLLYATMVLLFLLGKGTVATA
jgi:hypothetical protein